MSAMGLGLVVGWCTVRYAATGTSRGWLLTVVLGPVAAAVSGVVATPSAGAWRCLGAAGVGAAAHLGLRRLLSAGDRRAAA